MKDHFIRMFNYDKYANNIIVSLIIKANEPAKEVQLMGHTLFAQKIWIKRCQNLPAPGSPLWPDTTVQELEQMIKENHRDWVNYINELQPEDFEKTIFYKNSAGDSFQNRLSDIIAHVINHGTHHRAQIGQHLKSVGIEALPSTDYAFYLRSLNS